MKGKSKKILAYLLLSVMLVSMIAGCTNTPGNTTGDDKPLKPITVSVNVMEAEKAGKNPKTDYIKDEFGIEFDYVPVDWGTWNEKVKTWVNANDTPDLIWMDLKGASSQDYKNWSKDGAFKELKMDQLATYPELKRMSTTMKSVNALKVDGKLYAWPASRNNPPESKDTYDSVWWYRRDWAKVVGLYKEGDVYTYEEWVAMIKAVIEKDPGKNGAGNTAGLVMSPWGFPHAAVLFIGPVLAEGNETCSYIKDENGKYIWPATLPEYRDNVIKTYELYQQGIIWKDNILFNGEEAAELFKAGRAFAKYNGDVTEWTTTMLKNGLIKDKTDVGAAIITFDGKHYMTQTEDYWSCTSVSSKVDDEKLSRILSMWNFLNSEDGKLFRWLGFEGKDYNKKSDGSIEVLWKKDDATGLFVDPYADFRFFEFQTASLEPAGNPGKSGYYDECLAKVWDYMSKNPTTSLVKPFDYESSFFSAPNKDTYGTFGADCKAKLIELLQNSDNIGADWDAWVESMMPKVQLVLDELNNGIK